MNLKFLIALILAATIVFAGCVSEVPELKGPPEVVPTPKPVTQPPAADLCDGVTCPDKCEGTTRYEQGSCVEGKCTYASVTEKAEACGYVSVPEQFEGLQLDTELVKCWFDKTGYQFQFFISIRNNGTRATAKGATVHLLSDFFTKKVYETVNNPSQAQPGKYLWEEKKWTQALGVSTFHGEDFVVDSPDERTDFDYQVYYCENERTWDACTAENGLLLFEGNTTADCEERA